jgi:hypothetical protein
MLSCAQSHVSMLAGIREIVSEIAYWIIEDKLNINRNSNLKIIGIILFLLNARHSLY